MKTFSFILVWLCILICGCTSSSGVTRALDSWIGSTKSQIVARKGAPSSEYALDSGDHILVYKTNWYSAAGDHNEDCVIQFYIGNNGKIYKTMWQHCSKNSTARNWRK
jgi:hypothetical protein